MISEIVWPCVILPRESALSCPAPLANRHRLNQILPFSRAMDNARNLGDSVRSAIQDQVIANRKQAHIRSHIKPRRPRFWHGAQCRKCLVEAIKPMLRGDRVISRNCEYDAFDITYRLRQQAIGHAAVLLAVVLANLAWIWAIASGPSTASPLVMPTSQS